MIEKTHTLLLTTSAVAELLEVHPSTVKRWSEEGALPSSKTAGGHRRFHLRDVLAAARDRGIETFLDPFNPWEANAWRALSAAAGADGFGRFHGLALAWLAGGETELLGRLFFEAGRRKEIPLTRFLDDGVRGFMATVGEEWRTGRLQVGEEHMATQVILEALLRLRLHREAGAARPAGPKPALPVAVVGSMEGDHHDLGAQAIRALLEEEGWRVYYLGPNVPVEEFSAVQQAQLAELVCISFSSKNTRPDLQRAVRVLAEFYRPRSPFALALGGTLEGVETNQLGPGPFEALTFSSSADEFSTWLRSYSRTFGSGDPRRVA